MKLHSAGITSLRKLNAKEGETAKVNAWVMNKRTSKNLVFLILRDGSGFAQCVVSTEDVDEDTYEIAKSLPLESSIYVEGSVRKDERQIGGYELQASELEVYSESEEYPIGKKEHGVDFLMDQRHLWLRSRRQWAIMRVRNQIIFAINSFFQQEGFVQMDAPIFTGNAAEGTTTLFETDFFDQPAYLSQSGQLYGEAMAMAMGKIYTFGPTFRAEKSKTRRHLSEFWMIEPEMAFYNNEMNMDLIEKFIRYVVKSVLKECKFELEQLDRPTDTLEKVDQAFPRLSYHEAVDVLKGKKEVNGKNAIEVLKSDLDEVKQQIKSTEEEIKDKEGQLEGQMKKGKRNWMQEKVRQLKVSLKELKERERNIPQWLESAENFEFGNDFGGSDETVITRLFETPIMVYNWPKGIKAFYMKEVDDSPEFVKGVDVLAPEGYGEIVGGAERETDKEVLIESIKKHNLPMDVFEWYLDLRRYGSVPHAGFGLGLERFITWICKLDHLRESIPFPRMMGRLFP